jgi:hypothetical protein
VGEGEVEVGDGIRWIGRKAEHGIVGVPGL